MSLPPPYSVMSQTAFGQTAADGIVVHDDFLAHLIACPLVCQSAHFQDRARHLETEDRDRLLQDAAVLAAPEERVASGKSAETHIHAYLSQMQRKKGVSGESVCRESEF